MLSVKRKDRDMGWGQNLHVVVKEVSSGRETIFRVGPSDIQTKSCEVSVERLFSGEGPYDGHDLIRALQVHSLDSKKIRVGAKHDGGYVMNEMLLSSCSRLVSLGIGREDTFEREWVRLKPGRTVECYDGSCYCGMLCHENMDLVGKSIYHINKNVGEGRDQIPLGVIVGGKSDMLLKIDIEGGEYSLFENADLSGVVGLLMEVHDMHIPEKRSALSGIIRTVLKDFVLFHLHGNVWGGSFPLVRTGSIIKDFPKVLELSFARYGLCNDLGLDGGKFPADGLDFTNDANRKDLNLNWINSI